MCGIAGFCSYGLDYTTDPDRWQNTLIQIRRRGDDNTGEYLDRHVGLGHTRLSIRDLACGAQPIVRNRDGSDYVIIYNGEIYNTDELKTDLRRAGYLFKTTTDTEVILYCYMQYGPEFVHMLNGIFAFAIWDGRTEQLLLYRDRAGVKPLFYSIRNGELIFGSEIKALFCHPAVKPEIDLDSFREIFGIGPARTPGNGVFKGIHAIKPGCCAVYSRDGFPKNSTGNSQPGPTPIPMTRP